jgi:hypothetical protein
MDLIAIGAVAVLVTLVIGRTVGPYWVVGQLKAGRMRRRTATWLMVLLTVMPYVLAFGFAFVSDPGSWWIFALLFVASWPVIVLPVIAVIHAAGRESS